MKKMNLKITIRDGSITRTEKSPNDTDKKHKQNFINLAKKLSSYYGIAAVGINFPYNIQRTIDFQRNMDHCIKECSVVCPKKKDEHAKEIIKIANSLLLMDTVAKDIHVMIQPAFEIYYARLSG